eukprot:6791306-Prymnesium_polylepis.1
MSSARHAHGGLKSSFQLRALGALYCRGTSDHEESELTQRIRSVVRTIIVELRFTLPRESSLFRNSRIGRGPALGTW